MYLVSRSHAPSPRTEEFHSAGSTALQSGVGVGVLLEADSQSTSTVWVSGLPLGPLTRFYLALLFSSGNYVILLSRRPL
jgi:hypothetical protein